MTIPAILIAFALGVTLSWLACAVYVAHLFASAPLMDDDERLASDEGRAA